MENENNILNMLSPHFSGKKSVWDQSLEPLEKYSIGTFCVKVRFYIAERCDSSYLIRIAENDRFPHFTIVQVAKNYAYN